MLSSRWWSGVDSRRKALLWVCAVFSWTGGFALAEISGETVYEVCEVCHGVQGEGNEAFGAPKLSGQHDWYLTTQLENFRGGLRGVHKDDENGQIMRPMALTLSDEAIEAVVEYIGTFDPNYVEEDEDAATMDDE